MRNRLRTILLLPFIALAIALSSADCFGQGLNFPIGTPTGIAGAGNALTDSENFFTRNNIAGMTEIPLNDEEENRRPSATASKGLWRFNFEQRLLFYKFENDTLSPDRVGHLFPISTNSSLINPNFAGEATYTAGNHRYAFGFGAYQLVDFQSRFRLDDDELPDAEKGNAGLYDTRFSSTDFALAGAARLHKRLSVGAAFLFGYANIMLKQPDAAYPPVFFSRHTTDTRADLSGIGAPGLAVGFHFRPFKFLSIGGTFRNRRNYDLNGAVRNILTYTNTNGNVTTQFRPSLRAQTSFSLPAMGEAGVSFHIAKLTLTGDYRYYNYSDTIKRINVYVQQPASNIYAFFWPYVAGALYPADVSAVLAGAIYRYSDRTRLNFGFTYNSVGFGEYDLNPGIIDTGNAVTGGIEKKIKGTWYSFSAAAVIGRDRSFLNNLTLTTKDRFAGHGFLFSIGLRMKS